MRSAARISAYRTAARPRHGCRREVGIHAVIGATGVRDSLALKRLDGGDEVLGEAARALALIHARVAREAGGHDFRAAPRDVVEGHDAAANLAHGGFDGEHVGVIRAQHEARAVFDDGEQNPAGFQLFVRMPGLAQQPCAADLKP